MNPFYSAILIASLFPFSLFAQPDNTFSESLDELEKKATTGELDMNTLNAINIQALLNLIPEETAEYYQAQRRLGTFRTRRVPTTFSLDIKNAYCSSLKKIHQLKTSLGKLHNNGWLTKQQYDDYFAIFGVITRYRENIPAPLRADPLDEPEDIMPNRNILLHTVVVPARVVTPEGPAKTTQAHPPAKRVGWGSWAWSFVSSVSQ